MTHAVDSRPLTLTNHKGQKKQKPCTEVELLVLIPILIPIMERLCPIGASLVGKGLRTDS